MKSSPIEDAIPPDGTPPNATADTSDDATTEATSLRTKPVSVETELAVLKRAVAPGTPQLEAVVEQLEHERRRRLYSEERLASMLEAALDAVICFDAHGVVIEWNPQAELILGWSKEQALGQTVESLHLKLPRSNASQQAVAPGRDTPNHASGEKTWADGLLLDQRLEAAALHRDGWEFPVEVSIARLGAGPDAIFSAFLRDITVRKETEQDLEEARDGALAASRSKSEFLATMSHETRTPMNGLVGMAELLLSTKLTPEQHNYVEAIQGSAEGLLAVLSDILDYSRMEIGQFSIESIPFDLQQVVEETADQLAAKAIQKTLELTVDYPANAPAGFLGDPGRLRQVLTNLIGNAVKFTQVGRVSVNVECKQVTDASAGIRITVADTGIGIPAEKLDYIFKKLTRGDSSTTRKHQGMGLGLAITKRLAEMMGGSLRVESELGKGSRFFLDIELPRDSQAAAMAASIAALAGLRVLVVDQSESSRSFVRDQLKANGVVARTAAGGRAALAALHLAHEAGTPFDVVLIDYHLPDTEGETLALEIKSDSNLADTALVACTSVAGQRYASRMLLFGFAAIIVKPIRPSQLFRALARARGCLNVTPGGNASSVGAAAGRPNTAHAAQCRARVLVAEDSMVNQKVVARMLEKLDCAVDLVADGKQAAVMADAVRYDLIFMDCHMPEMDGFEATAAIRGRASDNQTPIIALTANAMEGDRERCLNAGMNDYLAKPIKVSDLTDMLHRWVPITPGHPR